MARIVVFAPVPPSRSEAASAGAALVRLLKRSPLRRRHAIRSVWPVPEAVDALLRDAELPIYLLSDDPEDREIYLVAMDHPGLVILATLSQERVIDALVRAHDPIGSAARREAERLAPLVDGLDLEPAVPWCAQAVRRARGVVVHSDADRRYLEALGCKTPLFVAPPPLRRDSRGYVEAVEATLRLVLDPAEWTLARWTAALTAVGVTAAWLREGYGVRYVEALEEIRAARAGTE